MIGQATKSAVNSEAAQRRDRRRWLIAALLVLALLVIARYPTRPWGIKTDDIGPVSPGLRQTELLGQTVVPERGQWSYLNLRFSTYRYVPAGRVIVSILTGGRPPADLTEAESRTVRRISFPAELLSDNAGRRIDFKPLHFTRGQPFFVLIGRQEADPLTPLSLRTADWTRPGPAGFALKADQRGGLKAERLTGGLVIALGTGPAKQSLLASFAQPGAPWGWLVALAAAIAAVSLVARWIVGLAADLAGEMWTGDDAANRVYGRLTLAFLAVGGLAMVLLVRDYGFHADEYLHINYGDKIVEFFLTGGADRSALSYLNLFLYGGLFDGAVSLINLFSPLGEYLTKHVVLCLVGWLGLIGCWRLAGRLAGPRTALYAVVLLALTPSYWGHLFNNIKDIPFAVGYVWSVYYLVLCAEGGSNPPLKTVLRLAVAVGLTMAVRTGGIILWGYAGLIGLGGAIRSGWQLRSLPETLAYVVVITFRLGLPLALISYIIMIASWPYALAGPWGHVIDSLTSFGRFPIQISTLFQGAQVLSTDLPRGYLPVYLLVKLPEFLLLPAAGGLVWGLWAWAKGRRPGAGIPVVVLATVFPVAYAVLSRTPMYDAIRHFLFIIPPLAALAATALNRATDWAGRRPAWFQCGLTAILAFYFLGHVGLMGRLHPYEYIYYNRFIGGVPGAVGRFELDHMQHTYVEAFRLLEAKLKRELGREYPRTRFRLLASGWPREHGALILPPNWRQVFDGERYDFSIASTRRNRHLKGKGEIYAVVRRLGIGLNYIKDARE